MRHTVHKYTNVYDVYMHSTAFKMEWEHNNKKQCLFVWERRKKKTTIFYSAMPCTTNTTRLHYTRETPRESENEMKWKWLSKMKRKNWNFVVFFFYMNNKHKKKMPAKLNGTINWANER